MNNAVSWVQSCQLLFVLPSVTWRKGLRGERWSLWQCNDSLETYTSGKWYQQRRVPAGPRCDTWQPDMDVQLWAIGKMCPVTAGRPHPDHSRSVQALIPPLSPWSHACLSATCLPLPLISAQSALSSCLVFVSASLKAPTAAGEPTLISGAVVSRLVLMLRVSGYVRERERKEKKGFLQTGQCRHVRLYQILSLGLSFCGVTTDSFSTKALVKEWETSVTAPLTCHHRLVLRPGVEGFSFSFCTIIPSSVIFIRSATHQRNISLEAFITYETGGGESWAVSHSWEATEKWCCDLNATDASTQFAFLTEL